MKNRSQRVFETLTCRVGLLLRAVVLVGLAVCVMAPLNVDAGTNVVLRLDASQFQSAGNLTAWSDISGNGHDTTAYSDPEVILAEQNGLPVVSLDGNDYFIAAHSYTTGTAFAVAKFDNTVWNFYDGLYGASTGGGSAEQYWTGSGSGAGTDWSNEAGAGFFNSKYRNGFLSNGALTEASAFNLYSGVDSTPTNFASWSIGTDRFFGASRAWEGDIAEVIVYDDALSDFGRKGVEVYLDEKWGLGLNLRTTYGEDTFSEDLQALGLAATDITMVLRLDASEFESAVTGLSTWEDSSGNGNDATQESSSLQPNVVLNVQNGLPVVRCDGSDDYMTVAHTYTTGSAFIIAKYTSTTFNWWDGLYGSATNNDALGIYWSGVNTSSSWDNSGGTGFYNSKYLNGTLSNTALTDPSAYNLYSGIDYEPNTFTSWSLGRDRGIGGRTWEGDIAEVIVYQEALSSFDRKGVEVYLDEKWGLGLNLRATYGVASFNNDPLALGLRPPQGTVITIQ